jgi:hypothetical protein
LGRIAKTENGEFNRTKDKTKTKYQVSRLWTMENGEQRRGKSGMGM